MKTKTSHVSKFHQLTYRLHKIDNNYPKQISTHGRQNMKLINKNISKASNTLKEIQKNSRTIREECLNQRMQGAKIHGNNKHYKYLANLIVIEHQQQMHSRIQHHTHIKQSSGIKYIEMPTNNTIPWNSVSSSLPED